MTNALNEAHWTDANYKQRMTTKDWKQILLDNKDQITYCGFLTKLKAKNLGCGVVEVSKERAK